MYWYALYTKPRWEKKVNDALLKNGLESYCPLNRVTRQWSDRTKKVEVPLFPSYVFVRVEQSRQTEVRMVSGVVNFVYWLGKPAVIRDDEMEALKSFVDTNENIIVEAAQYREGDSLHIDQGVFKGQKAIVQKINKNKLELLLETLQLRLVVERF